MLFGFVPFEADNTCAENLLIAGCHKIIVGPESNNEAALRGLIGGLCEKDMLVFCKLDHLGSMTDLIQIAIELGKKKAHLKVVAQDIDTLRDSLRYLHHGI
nr:hypothetical protein [Dyadobacter fermentans]